MQAQIDACCKPDNIADFTLAQHFGLIHSAICQGNRDLGCILYNMSIRQYQAVSRKNETRPLTLLDPPRMWLGRNPIFVPT